MVPPKLDRAQIAALIPHDGAMCLLDQVVDWQPEVIHCLATSHRAADNPMRLDGRLGVASGIEYAAQAMAVHGALRARRETAAKKGYLTRVQQISFHVDALDACAEPLAIEARLLMGNAQIVRYAFSVSAGGRLLLDGQATVMLEAGLPD
ncbi:3-hydroxylacyl-ACP dehydratase [Halothiobacillus diazotrophicus]|uniref:3-hydroxylacyl-ACP dehydratase n=1 Tax=Halothiobacillus diazotrophicus TaxID=1860122 RepID=A0A191ZJJ2_9GAMM|nr:3-hydroxylacyl-ACP dehydratase [Halothiobacillus diazotrophicus]ANJ68035.1 3-hydroxylacyl-ACP dehydratase [Halothiobacillus diazotrophicus]